MDGKGRRKGKCLDLLEKTRGMGGRDCSVGTFEGAMGTTVVLAD